MILETIYVITWLVICPLEHNFDMRVEVTTHDYGYSWDDVKVIECPKHHVMLAARPEKIVKMWKEVKPAKEPNQLYVETTQHEEDLIKPTNSHTKEHDEVL